MIHSLERFNRDMTLRGLSASAIDRYNRALSWLCDYYDGADPKTLTDDQVQDFIYELAVTRKHSWGHVNSITSGLRFYYHTTLRHNEKSFVVPIAKKRKKLPVIFSKSEVLSLFATVGHDSRKTAFFRILYGCGLRVSEACRLRLADIDSGNQRLWIRNAKGGKDRGVFLSRETYKALSRWWRASKFDDLVFESPFKPGQSIQKNTPSAWFGNMCKEAGIIKSCGLHTWRHSYATHMLENGASILEIKENLGHSCLRTTMIYLQLAGATPGILGVLHTWGQKLNRHVHVHFVVTGGGLDVKGNWIDGRGGDRFLFPVKAMSPVFRARYWERFHKLIQSGTLRAPREQAGDIELTALKNRLYKSNWTVYAKKPFGGPAVVLKYLGRYTHRVAISNQRILNFSNGMVTFAYKDYRDEDRNKSMSLPLDDFLIRFVQHIMPKGCMRIRGYGLLANARKKAALSRCREILGAPSCADTAVSEIGEQDEPVHVGDRDIRPCPSCKNGKMSPFPLVERVPDSTCGDTVSLDSS